MTDEPPLARRQSMNRATDCQACSVRSRTLWPVTVAPRRRRPGTLAAVRLELEFTVEPFEPGSPGRHVRAAEEAARSIGGELVIGPFGPSLAGERDQVLEAVGDVVRAAMAAGATRVTLQVSRGSDDGT